VGNPSADLYGSDRMVLESVRGLVRAGWRVVVAASVDGPLRHELERAGAEFVTVPVPVVRRSNLSPLGLLRLAQAAVRGVWPMGRLVRRLRPDVVYVNTVTVPLWPVVARALGCNVVVHVHEAESSASALARVGLSLPTRLAHLVICNSETSRQVMVQSGGWASRIVVVPNGVAGPERVVPARDEVDGPRLVLVGRVSPRKGTDVAIRVVRMLHDRGVRARLDVVGDVFPGYEWYDREVRALAEELGVSDFVTFSGFTRDVWPHLAGADVALVTSRQDESFGNGVVEAALAARPVVVSDHSGLREASQGLKSAILVHPDAPDEVADAVEKVLADWTAHRLAAAYDAETAAQQRSPARYRAQVRAELEGLLQD
jgi:glycosyltransferase involved in cell wall biosynthesis